jgi:uncharacterized protein YqiB (DUF1249 family)
MRPAAKRELNDFLELWLGNLIEQGHKAKIAAN